VTTGMPALAIDIGGTKLAAAAVEPGGRLIVWAQVPTPRDVDSEQLWRTVEMLAQRVLDEAKIETPADLAGVAAGCGGPMQWPAGVVSPLHIPAWRSFPLRARLRDRFESIPVRVHNDAVCLVAGEHWRGAGRGRDNVLGMVVSTGVGGGLILGGRVVEGASGNAGHIGHVVVDPEDGPPCPCGGRGCLEAIASGPAIVAWAQDQGWRTDQPDATASHLAADAAQGHPVGLAAMRRAGHALGVAIASATLLCDLEVVSIGGGLSQAGAVLFDPLEESLRAHVRLQFARQVRVVAAALGQSAGLVGAAALIFAADRYWTSE
jgi:glucokinase